MKWGRREDGGMVKWGRREDGGMVKWGREDGGMRKIWIADSGGVGEEREGVRGLPGNIEDDCITELGTIDGRRWYKLNGHILLSKGKKLT